MMLRTGPTAGLGETADFTVDVNWTAGQVATDPSWRWKDLPDLVGPTVLPSGPQGPGTPDSDLPGWMKPDLTGPYQQGSGGNSGGLLTTGGIDIGLPGFGLGPDVNVNYPGKEKVAALSSTVLAIGALIIGLLIFGQVRK